MKVFYDFFSTLEKDKSYQCGKIAPSPAKKKWFVIIVNQTKWMLHKYPVNAYGVRDGLSGDMLTLSRRNLVYRSFYTIAIANYCIFFGLHIVFVNLDCNSEGFSFIIKLGHALR